MENIEMFFYQGYGGAPKCEVRINGEAFVLETDEAKRVLLKGMEERGYTRTKTTRQKYPRVTIND